MKERLLTVAAPAVVAAIFLLAWEALVRIKGIPHFVLPSPILVAKTFLTDGPSLLGALWVTLKTTFAALAAAVLLGLGIAVLLAQSRLIERSVYPYLVTLQVTPVVSIAPLIIIWVNDLFLAVLICAWIVAFFPIVANTTLGLKSVAEGHGELFDLFGARRWQRLRYLQLPTALPYFLAGVRISGGLALIGAVVAEFVAGTGGTASGLAFRILEAGYRLQIPRMFAALILLAVAGIAIHAVLGWVSRSLLRGWHESAIGTS